jgi:hypothetical protein
MSVLDCGVYMYRRRVTSLLWPAKFPQVGRPWHVGPLPGSQLPPVLHLGNTAITV